MVNNYPNILSDYENNCVLEFSLINLAKVIGSDIIKLKSKRGLDCKYQESDIILESFHLLVGSILRVSLMILLGPSGNEFTFGFELFLMCMTKSEELPVEVSQGRSKIQ